MTRIANIHGDLLPFSAWRVIVTDMQEYRATLVGIWGLRHNLRHKSPTVAAFYSTNRRAMGIS
jgi:hypothetical protein